MNTYTEEQFDWRVGPCAGMTWLQWCDAQAEMSGEPTLQELLDNEANEEKEANDDNEQRYNEANEEKEANDDNEQHYIEANDDNEEEIECPPAPRAALRSVRRLSFGTFVKEKSIHHNSIEIPKTPEPAPRVVRCPDAPKKAKTRAEKRAADPESENSDTGDSDFVTPKKKERRSDYWMLQDDLKIKRARAFKHSANIEIIGV
jgi:hypothetical protein